MSCEHCTSILRYGKRVESGRRVCIDCWKDKVTPAEKSEEDSTTDDGE